MSESQEASTRAQRPAQPSLVQPSIRDPRHLAYEIVYRDQLAAFDVRKFLLYSFVSSAEGEPGSPPSQALPYLARQFSVSGVDGWNLAETEGARRNLIQNRPTRRFSSRIPATMGFSVAECAAGKPMMGSRALPPRDKSPARRHSFAPRRTMPCP